MNQDKKSFIKEIKDYASSLKLNAIKTDIANAIDEANKNNLSYEEFLFTLLQKEHDIREYNLTQSRLRLANFPYKKYLKDLSMEELPADAKNKLKHLSSLKFIENGQNVILSGNPGTGNYRKFLLVGVSCL
ncbi:ATP-binding protein [Clostridium sp. PL3]|uniref:ATP-binding protein n=1 Tax=Clostridium thailandense TaxID=2794346 RepID=A0A949TX30_9CLOT|nr:ATP-binding protein [Clostridium thailandense]MBV7276837.1 ATP-binding protein [Clostridium thailandense]